MRQHLVFALLLLGGAAGADGPRTLRVLATTDLHGHLEESALLGGYLAIERREHPGGVLLVDGGDLFTGTLESDLGEGAGVIRAMNALGYDAAAVGNHDFDFGPVGPNAIPHAAGDDPRGALKARIGEARFPLLTANVVEADGKPLAGTRRFVVLTVDHVKVGVVGGTTESTPSTTMLPNLAGLRILPLAPAIAAAADEARRAGAKVVIVTVHAGGECPRRAQPLTDAKPGDLVGCQDDSEVFKLARALAPEHKVDAIFGGHTHKPLMAVVGGIPVAQADARGLAYSALELELDTKSGAPTGKFRLELPVELHADQPFHGQKVAPDAKVASAIAADLARAVSLRAEPVGVRLDGKLWRSYGAESPMGNLLAEIVRAHTATDVAVLNGGGLRADLPAGELRYGALFETLPFANHLATMQLRGADFRRILQHNFEGPGGILSLAGVTVDARCANHALDVKITLASGKALGDDDPLSIGTSDFLALGGDDFSHLPAHAPPRIDDAGPTLRDVVGAAFKKRGSIRADDPSLFDPAHPRIKLPGPRPIRCP